MMKKKNNDDDDKDDPQVGTLARVPTSSSRWHTCVKRRYHEAAISVDGGAD